jgi:transposase
MCHSGGVVTPLEEVFGSKVITIGLDIAKNDFHAHGADERGAMVFSRKLTRGKLLGLFAGHPTCTVALEACGGAHHWAHQLQARQKATLDREIARSAKEDEAARRLMTILGIGPIAATAIIALTPPIQTFHKGRDFAAWLGLAPRQYSTGGKQRLGSITKMGDRTIRRLLIIGAIWVVLKASRRGAPCGSWLERMLARKPRKLARSRSPTRWRVWSGRCLPERKITELRPRSRRKLRKRSEASGT